jgi:hypothetical protein
VSFLAYGCVCPGSIKSRSKTCECFLDEGEKRIWSACEVCVWEDRLSARYVSIVLLNMDKLLSLATIPGIVGVKKYHYNNSLLPQTSTVVDAKESTGVLLVYRSITSIQDTLLQPVIKPN